MAFVDEPVNGIAMLLWHCEPDDPQRLATPFFHAAAAGAMEIPVEIYFSARSVRLLAPGVAESLRASALSPKTILDAMREALSFGAKLFACTDAVHAQGLDPQGLIAECSGHGGAVQFMARAADRRWRALVF